MEWSGLAQKLNGFIKNYKANDERNTSLIIPNTKLLDGVVKVFVRTGPTYGDVGCSVDRSIEVDLVLPGAFLFFILVYVIAYKRREEDAFFLFLEVLDEEKTHLQSSHAIISLVSVAKH